MNLYIIFVLFAVSRVSFACVSVPLSVSNISSCLGSKCRIHYVSQMKINMGSSVPTCFRVDKPDGTHEEVKIKIDSHMIQYGMKRLFISGDALVRKVKAYCECPDGNLFKRLPHPVSCRSGTICMKRSYFEDVNLSGSRNCFLPSGNTLNTYTFEIVPHSNYYVYELLRYAHILRGRVIRGNDTFLLHWDSSKDDHISVTDSLKIREVSYEETHKKNLIGRIIVINRNDPAYVYILERELINFGSFDVNKLGWFRYTDEGLLYDLNIIRNNFHVGRTICDSTGYYSVFNRREFGRIVNKHNEVGHYTGMEYNLFMPHDRYVTEKVLNNHIVTGHQPNTFGKYNKFISVFDRDTSSSVLVSNLADITSGCRFSVIRDGVYQLVDTITTRTCVGWNGSNFTKLHDSYYRLYEYEKHCFIESFVHTLHHKRNFSELEEYIFDGEICKLIKAQDGKITISGLASPVDGNSYLRLFSKSFSSMTVSLDGVGTYTFLNDVVELPGKIICKVGVNNTLSIVVDSHYKMDLMITSSVTGLIQNQIIDVKVGKHLHTISFMEPKRESDVTFKFCNKNRCKKCDIHVNNDFDLYRNMKTDITNFKDVSRLFGKVFPKITFGNRLVDLYVIVVVCALVALVLVIVIVALFKFVVKYLKEYSMVFKVIIFPVYLPYLLFSWLISKVWVKDKRKFRRTAKIKSRKVMGSR